MYAQGPILEIYSKIFDLVEGDLQDGLNKAMSSRNGSKSGLKNGLELILDGKSSGEYTIARAFNKVLGEKKKRDFWGAYLWSQGEDEGAIVSFQDACLALNIGPEAYSRKVLLIMLEHASGKTSRPLTNLHIRMASFHSPLI